MILICFTSSAQTTYLSHDEFAQRLTERYELLIRQWTKGDASSLKPLNREALNTLLLSMDTLNIQLSEVDQFNLRYLKALNLPHSGRVNALSKKKLPLGIYHTKANFWEVNDTDFKLYVNPGFNLQFGYSDIDEKPLYTNTRSVEIRGQINDRLGFYSFISENQLRASQHEKLFTQEHNAFPGAHLVKDFKNGSYDFFGASGYITFRLLPAISIQFGQGRNFIGHGQRSLLLSNFATDYTFVKINTKVWRLNYQNIYAKLIDKYGSQNQPFPSKYMAAHYLGVDLLPNLNLGFFETVIFHDNRKTGRGFDLYYLNPIIFYRSVEHMLGDADKMLVGLNTAWLPYSGIKLYAQLMVNEFRISDLREQNGHAANKFGYQLGMKYINIAGIPNLDFNAEYNRVRPYSYAHYTMDEDTHPVNSYSHYNQPLAHPLGANFSELLISLNAQPLPRLSFNFNLITAYYGTDTIGTNWGGNIFLDYRTYEQELNNTVGQGITTNLTIVEAITSWHIKHNLFIDFELKYRNLNSDIKAKKSTNLYLGTALRLNLERRRWVY